MSNSYNEEKESIGKMLKKFIEHSAMKHKDFAKNILLANTTLTKLFSIDEVSEVPDGMLFRLHYYFRKELQNSFYGDDMTPEDLNLYQLTVRLYNLITNEINSRTEELFKGRTRK